MQIADFITVLESELDEPVAGAINANTPFRQLDGWNSMMALIIIARIDADYSVTISAQDLAKAQTVQELYDLVKSRM
jgi:acyl carrier protein